VALLALTLIVSAALSFGISAQDVTRTREFADVVRSWQHDPDFPRVEREYVARGVGRDAGARAGRVGRSA
jgi:hypothetical protein